MFASLVSTSGLAEGLTIDTEDIAVPADGTVSPLLRYDGESVGMYNRDNPSFRAGSGDLTRASMGNPVRDVLHWVKSEFGKAPTRRQQQKLSALTDVQQLEILAERLLDTTSWTELLAAP